MDKIFTIKNVEAKFHDGTGVIYPGKLIMSDIEVGIQNNWPVISYYLPWPHVSWFNPEQCCMPHYSNEKEIIPRMMKAKNYSALYNYLEDYFSMVKYEYMYERFDNINTESIVYAKDYFRCRLTNKIKHRSKLSKYFYNCCNESDMATSQSVKDYVEKYKIKLCLSKVKTCKFCGKVSIGGKIECDHFT